MSSSIYSENNPKIPFILLAKVDKLIRLQSQPKEFLDPLNQLILPSCCVHDPYHQARR